MIIDCFTFNKEFDLLEGRMEYLNDIVDYFVIVEADITFSGIPREFQYVKNISRFQRFQHKILYFPFSMDCTGLDFTNPVQNFDYNTPAWKVESAQRNHFLAALRLFNDSDYVIINDVDEIPSKVGITTAITHLSEEMPKIVCNQQMFYYNFNQIQKDPWFGSIITTVKHVKEQTPQSVRLSRDQIITVTNGGWHLSNWMTPQEIQEKIQSFSHQEFNKPQYTNLDTITKNLLEGKDFLGRDLNIFLPFDAQTLPSDFKSIFLKFEKQLGTK